LRSGPPGVAASRCVVVVFGVALFYGGLMMMMWRGSRFSELAYLLPNLFSSWTLSVGDAEF